VIELTPEMRAAVKRRMGVPDGRELDPWMGAAIEDVLALVERDYEVSPRPKGWLIEHVDHHGVARVAGYTFCPAASTP
jgi:hypothetical protein